MGSRSILELIVRQKKEGQAIKQTEKEVKGLGKTVKSLGIGFAAAGGAALAAGAVMKKAFDLGREGAVVAQTAESFDLLMDSIGGSTDLLEELRAAARGTVDDTQLMSSTMTLLAGASGDLAPALAAATPELLNIAKAANKLNPALGDTTFLYQSIATGVKRAQPLILDNLGLTIKVGEANERMAEQLGKSVEGLTAEEKSMAILNDTLRAGRVLVDQVGGSTEGAGDAYAQLATELKNASDAGKVWIDEFLRPVITTMGQNMKALRLLREQLDLGTISQKEYGEAVIDLRHGQLEAADAIAFAEQKQREFNDSIPPVIAGLSDEKAAIVALRGEVGELGGAFDGVEGKIKNAVGALSNYSREALAAALVNDALSQAMSDAIIDQDELNRIDALAERFGVDLPEDLQATVSNFNALASQGIDPATASGDELADVLLGIVGVTGELTAREHRIVYNIEVTGDPIPPGVDGETFTIQTGGGAVDAQHGLDMIVPPGFPNDTFPIRASSGERVTVTPAGQTTNNVDNSRSALAGATVNIQSGLDESTFDDMIRQWMGG